MRREIWVALLIFVSGLSGILLLQDLVLSNHVNSEVQYFSNRLNVEPAVTRNNTQTLHFTGEINVTIPARLQWFSNSL